MKYPTQQRTLNHNTTLIETILAKYHRLARSMPSTAKHFSSLVHFAAIEQGMREEERGETTLSSTLSASFPCVSLLLLPLLLLPAPFL